MKIEFNTDGAAFDTEDDKATYGTYYERKECARILRKIADQLDDGGEWGSIMDINGNKVGRWEM